MAKKRQRPLAAVQKKKEAAPNRFELLSKKSKFEVLGKKAKGDTRNVLRLRSAAAEKVSQLQLLATSLAVMHTISMVACMCALAPKSPAAPVQRKSTLLVEYKQLRKSNAFIDRRFGGG